MGAIFQSFSVIGVMTAFFIALLVAITALNISSMIRYAKRRIYQLLWLTLGGIVFGFGVALVNLAATQSLYLPIVLSDKLPILWWTLALAVLSSIVGLYYVSQKKLTRFQLLLAGAAVGIGIVLLYRNWFLAIDLENAALNELPVLLTLMFISIVMNVSVVWIANHLRNHPKASLLRKNMTSGLVIAIAITGFFYSVTLATIMFTRVATYPFEKSGLNLFFTSYAIGLISVIVLGYVLIHEYMQRQLSVHRQRAIESDRKYESLFMHSHDAIIAISNSRTVMEINPAGLEMLGISQQQLKEVQLDTLLLPEYRDIATNNFEATLLGNSNNYDCAVTSTQGSIVFINVTNVPIYSEQEIIGAYFICRDITDRVQAEMQIEYMAYHDALTGLANLRLFEQKVEKAIQHATKKGLSFAILFLDMDDFKEVNDSLGHAYGDLLLQQISKRLENIIGTTGTVARRGGDEFTILLTNTAREKAKKIVDQLIVDISKPFDLEENRVCITTCVGIAIYPDDSLEYETLLKYADQAMYHAKEEGKNRYRFYEHSIATVR